MKENQMDKSLFFITLSCLCVWLIVDCAIGKNYLGNFLTILFPFMGEEKSTKTMTTKEVKEVEKKAPTSSAIGSNKESSSINSVPYGATRSNK